MSEERPVRVSVYLSHEEAQWLRRTALWRGVSMTSILAGSVHRRMVREETRHRQDAEARAARLRETGAARG